MRLQFNKFFAPPEDVPSTSGTSDDGKETFELLNEEPDEEEVLDITPKDKGKKDETDEGAEDAEGDGKEGEEEDDELKEIEQELEGPKEEDLELTTPVRRREILSKYPKLFKDFPYLEKAYYREQQFTELLPTINDAKAAVEKAQILDNVEQQIMGGDISSILIAAKNENHQAFLKIADNYLPTLQKVDPQAYFHVLGNVIKDTIITMVREGRALGEQGAPLQAAANVLNQFVFGSQNFSPPKPLSQPVKPEEKNREAQLQWQEQQRVMGTFESVKGDLQTRADNVLRSTIDQHIDPNGSMTDFVKKNATREAFETLEDLMAKDTRFHGLLDRLWEKAFQTNFDKKTTDQIKSAYLSKAKTLLPSVVKRARREALSGFARRNRDSSEEIDTETPTRKSPASTGKSTSPSSSGGKIRKPSDIPKGMSTLDVLMKD